MTANFNPDPEVLVVIVNYRTADLTIECLQSLSSEIELLPGSRVIVVDNDSQDGSAERIREAISANRLTGWCELQVLEQNGGFAFGNNAAIRPLLETNRLPDLVWLLNPDTRVHPGALVNLVQFMLDHPEVGIAGGRSEDISGVPLCSAFRFQSVLSEWEAALNFGPSTSLLRKYVVAPEVPSMPTRVDWVAGASMMIRRSVFEAIGLLDESYFMYFEETDFCMRAARAGFQVWYVPSSRIVHLVGGSSGVTGEKRAAKRRPKYWFDSRKRYFTKNLGPIRAHAANAAFIFGYPIGTLLLRLRGKRRSDPPNFWRDFVKYNYLDGA